MKNDEILQIFPNYLSIYDNWPLPPSGSFGVQNENSGESQQVRKEKARQAALVEQASERDTEAN